MIRLGNRIQMRAVERAAEIAEGIQPLAVYLGVPSAWVASWIQGTSGEVPQAVFLKVVEIIVDHGASRQRGAIPQSLVETFRHKDAANG